MDVRQEDVQPTAQRRFQSRGDAFAQIEECPAGAEVGEVRKTAGKPGKFYPSEDVGPLAIPMSQHNNAVHPSSAGLGRIN